MRPAAVEIVGVARPEEAPLAVDGDLELAAHHHRALLRFMAQHGLAGVGAGLVALVQDLHRPAGKIPADLAVGDSAAGELDQVGHAEEHRRRGGRLAGEELGEAERQPVQHLLERADRRAAAVLLDQRDDGIADAGPLGQLALRQAPGQPQRPQSLAEVERCALVHAVASWADC